MSSETHNNPESSSSFTKTKRTRKSSQIPLEAGQQCIASAMAKIIEHMVNKELQQRCKDLLEMEDMAETEARILFILQQIDKDREDHEKAKEANKQKRMKRKLENNK